MMRTFILILVLVALIVGGTILFLAVTTPHDATPLRFPLHASQLALLDRVPADAEAYALIAAPAVLHRRLLENPVTHDAVLQWREETALPPAMMIGSADAAIWKSGKITSYAIRLDPVRAMIIRIWLLFSHANAYCEGATLLVNVETAGAGAPEARGANGLEPGDIFVVQRRGARGAFPPIGRPALTSVRVTTTNIDIVSRATTRTPSSHAPFRATFPASAMLSVAFSDPPTILGDLDRLIAADVDALAGDGGLVALYDVDTGTLLPRPRGAIVIPADDDGRAAAAKYGRVIDMVGERVERGGQIVLAFDRTSARQYLEDASVPAAFPGNDWAVRLRPERLMPVLRKAGDNPGLRFMTPRLHRGMRDLRRWIDALEKAAWIEAVHSVSGDSEELRVRVASK